MSEGPGILVVEDNEDDVFFMRRALRAAAPGIDVAFVGDGTAALQYLRSHPMPAATFLDLKLPFMHGLDVLAIIRGDPALRSANVYILTSSSEERDRSRAAALGVGGYLVKPPTRQMLEPIVGQLRREPRLPER